MNRRKFLAVAGGGIVLAAGVSAGGFLMSRSPTRALRPWRVAGSLYSEPRRRALSYAILAPNPHNRQPWLVDLSKPDQVVLYADTERLLPHTDPFGRQITIGLGCFLELMRMAAAEEGYSITFELFPAGSDDRSLDRRPVAIATFNENKDSIGRDPLFRHVLARRSLKEPYDLNRSVSRTALAKIESAAANGGGVGTTNDRTRVEALRTLTRDAMIIEFDTPRTYQESVDLFRIGKTEIEANPDGIDFSGPVFEAIHLMGMFTREAAIDTSSTAYRQGRAAVLENMETAMAHVWIVSDTNSRVDQINSGRDWLRLNLAATGEGLGTQPLSQALQEYSEMKPLYDKIHAMLAPGGGTVQMLARLGFAPTVPPSPRWLLDTRIIEDTV